LFKRKGVAPRKSQELKSFVEGGSPRARSFLFAVGGAAAGAPACRQELATSVVAGQVGTEADKPEKTSPKPKMEKTPTSLPLTSLASGSPPPRWSSLLWSWLSTAAADAASWPAGC
jgi:hypothetical protein